MDREKEPLASRPNGRPASMLVVKEQGRKPLFASASSRGDDGLNNKPKDKENDRAQPNMSRSRTSLYGDGMLRRMSSEPYMKAAERRGSSSSQASSGGTRIPKPSGITFSNRKQLSLSEAFSRAAMDSEEESDQSHVMDASPSPAPRVARARREDEDRRLRKMMSMDHLDSKAPARPFSRASLATSTLPETRPSPDKHESPRRRTLYGKSRIGLGPREPARESVSPKPSGAKPEDRVEDPPSDPSSRLRPAPGLKHMPSKDDLTNQGRIPALVPGIEDLPWPSIENGGSQQEPAPPMAAIAEKASPEKSFAWQVEEDFTAGDLQISDSPRITMGARPFANRIKFDEGSEIDINSRTRVANPGSRNTKLDEIRSREVKAGNNIPLESPQRRQPNTKLDEIRHREAQAEHQIPIPDRSLPRPRNTKLEEIRQREINGIPNRALAKMRLEEIRELNSNSNSRSLSPEEPRPLSARTAREIDPPVDLETKEPVRPKSAFEIGGQRIPDTPVTIFKARETKYHHAAVEERGESGQEKDGKDLARPGLLHSHRRGDSRDLLRRLARAASTSPAPETEARRPASPLQTEKPITQDSDFKSAIPRRATENGPRQTQFQRKENETSKPTVGFVGLPRRRSTDSVKSKRSSMQSEMDPTDRIEAEMKLFAPGDNYSEKGSVRAPSPPDSDSEDEKHDVDATPRAPKPDPLSMPTPKVSGAYVETPATVKVEKIEVKDEKPREESKAERPTKSSASTREEKTIEDIPLPKKLVPTGKEEQPEDTPPKTSVVTRDVKAVEDRPRAKSFASTRDEKVSDEEKVTEEAKLPRPRSSAWARDKKTDFARRSQDQDTASDPGTDEKSAPTKTSAGLRRRRAHSLPRRRGPMKNTAKPPTVRDDLRELQRTHQIEDSTLDDLEEIISGRRAPTPQLAALLDNLSDHPPDDDDFDFDLDIDTKLNTKKNEVKAQDPNHSDGDQATLSRMTKSLETGLMGIRTAKKGIERLEDQVLHKTKSAEKLDAHTPDHVHCAACPTHSNPIDVSSIRLPLPPLYRRKPFRFTFLGLVLLLASLWYAAESAMCAAYCRPTTCGDKLCVWSFDDPTFGTALPVKLDQWTTGGHGRVLMDKLSEDVSDWTADFLDMYHGREITQINVDALSFEQKRQHRRRLSKKGLLKPRTEPPEQQAKWDAWRQARLAKERVQEAREMGYDVPEEGEGAVGGDERVW
ncbi:hypothetical protein AK830_g9398 [Neonectria ditissima]|uniref:Uncharacterized protein n=1 Tax=Neonectria ditissima TaxID=78410 RepID=A0A0P7AUY0_9HYPO|nr:hypothetical protein AK830_g9398 [Neonectria ditissima]